LRAILTEAAHAEGDADMLLSDAERLAAAAAEAGVDVMLETVHRQL
jgi:hypothetical protein